VARQSKVGEVLVGDSSDEEEEIVRIQVYTDNHTAGSAELINQVKAVVLGALDRFGDRITRVEVHLADQDSSQKFSDRDKRCLIEARLAGRQPIAVSHQGATLQQALDGAADKLQKALKRTLGRLDDPQSRTTRAFAPPT
jgi:ribosome-associated translation inhibitor RaiA